MSSFEFRIESLTALRDQYPPGSYATGPSFVLPEAVFALTVYPNGKTEADKDFVASYLSVQRLTQHGLEAVKIPATWSLHAVNDSGEVLHRISSSRAEFLSDVTVAGKGYVGATGWPHAFRVAQLPDSFIIRCCNLRIDDHVYREHTELAMALNAKPRVYSLKELHDLSLDELNTLVERAKVVIKDKEQWTETKCAVCLERERNVALVPCGHRFCSKCVESLKTSCPHCRSDVQSHLRVY